MKTLKVKSIFFSLLAIMIVAVFMVSCEQEVIPTPDLPDTAEELTLQKVAEILGVNPDELTESEDGYYHSNCMFYNRQLFESDSETLENRQHWKIEGLQRPTGTYRYDIDTNIEFQWQNGIAQAITKWNALKGAIHISNSPTGVVQETLRFRPKSMPWYVAASFSPSDDKIYVNTNYGGEDLTWDDKILVIMHEIGHYIGLAHVDGVNPGGFQSFLWTPESQCRDANGYNEFNVMNDGAIGSPNFSYCDKKAYEALHERAFIKSKHTNSYLCSENNHDYARANRSALGAWEKFKLKYNKSTDTYAIQASNGLYADLEQWSGRVRFERDRYCGDCQWKLEKKSGTNDQYYIKNNATGKYLKVDTSVHNNNYQVKCEDTNPNTNSETWIIRKLAWCNNYGDCQ